MNDNDELLEWERLFDDPEVEEDRLKRITIAAGEFVRPDHAFELEVDGELNPERLNLSMGVNGVAGKVELLDAGRVRWQASEPMTEGLYQFHVHWLGSPEGEVFVENLVLPFGVYHGEARVPEHLIAANFTRLGIDEFSTRRLPLGEPAEGEYFELFKTLDRNDDTPGEIAFDPAGIEIDAEEIFGRLDAAFDERFGKLHPTLAEKIEGLPGDELIRVGIWIHFEEPLLEDVKEEAGDPDGELTDAEQAALEELNAATGAVAEELGNQFSHREFARRETSPVISGEVSAAEAREISDHPGVAMVFFDDREIDEMLSNSLKVSEWQKIVFRTGGIGSGVNVAVFEDRPDVTTNLSLAGVRDSTARPSSHARLTSGIIKNTERGKPKGFAPRCNLFSANPADYNALDWACDTRRCTVISQSFGWKGDGLSPFMNFADLDIDRKVLKRPWPTICRAAGNEAEEVDRRPHWVSPKSYNTLTVGAHNDTGDAMASFSSWRNPVSPKADRELPEICANGTVVEAVGITGNLASGTSFAAPAVSGTAAVIQGVNSKLKGWPEGCRAILMASSARRPTLGTFGDVLKRRLDVKDGAGKLNVDRAVKIVQGGEATRNVFDGRAKWATGTLRDSDFDPGTGVSKWDHRLISAQGDFVQIALAWDMTINPSDLIRRKRTGLDLDLQVFNKYGRPVATSTTWDNSYEFISFRNHTYGAFYTIRIRKLRGTLPVWYGLAWISETRASRP